MPVTKREESLEPSIVSPASATLPGSSACLWGRVHEQATSPARGNKPLMSASKPSVVTKQAHLVPCVYQGSSPRKYKLAAVGNSGGQSQIPTPPVFSRFPSRLRSAMATGCINKTTAPATKTTTCNSRTRILPNFNRLTQHLQHRPNVKSNAIRVLKDTMDATDISLPSMFMSGTLKHLSLLCIVDPNSLQRKTTR
jgi:hypothetical protein